MLRKCSRTRSRPAAPIARRGLGSPSSSSAAAANASRSAGSSISRPVDAVDDLVLNAADRAGDDRRPSTSPRSPSGRSPRARLFCATTVAWRCIALTIAAFSSTSSIGSETRWTRRADGRGAAPRARPRPRRRPRPPPGRRRRRVASGPTSSRCGVARCACIGRSPRSRRPGPSAGPSARPGRAPGAPAGSGPSWHDPARVRSTRATVPSWRRKTAGPSAVGRQPDRDRGSPRRRRRPDPGSSARTRRSRAR